MIGQKFNRLTVLEEVNPYTSPQGKKFKRYLCLCDCGKHHYAKGHNLRGGRVRSCGCYMEESRRKPKKHGMIGTPEYTAWRNMIDRCYNENVPTYQGYGARGISVYPSWRKDFLAFYNDVGQRPSKNHSLGRIDNDGDYEPGNVRWETLEQQSGNKRWTLYVEYEGREVKLIDLCDELNLEISLVRGRIRNCGWTLEEAIKIPKGVRRKDYYKEIGG